MDSTVSVTIASCVGHLPCGERLLADCILDASRGCGGDAVGNYEIVGGVVHLRAAVEPLVLLQSSVVSASLSATNKGAYSIFATLPIC